MNQQVPPADQDPLSHKQRQSLRAALDQHSSDVSPQQRARLQQAREQAIAQLDQPVSDSNWQHWAVPTGLAASIAVAVLLWPTLEPQSPSDTSTVEVMAASQLPEELQANSDVELSMLDELDMMEWLMEEGLLDDSEQSQT